MVTEEVAKKIKLKRIHFRYEENKGICSNCRLTIGRDIQKENVVSSKNIDISPPNNITKQRPASARKDATTDDAPDNPLHKINNLLRFLGMPPELSRNVRTEGQKHNIFSQICSKISIDVFGQTNPNIFHLKTCPLAFNLKEAINGIHNNQETIKLLTIVPRDIPATSVASFFNCSKFIVKKSKDISETKGVYETTEKRKGRAIEQDIKQIVEKFYLRDDVSRTMPGVKDVVSIRNPDGSKVKQTKRLMLGA